MTAQTYRRMDPAADAFIAFIRKSRINLAAMAAWEKQFLGGYVREVGPTSDRSRVHRRKVPSQRG
jgi:hypothetical protein